MKRISSVIVKDNQSLVLHAWLLHANIGYTGKQLFDCRTRIKLINSEGQ